MAFMYSFLFLVIKEIFPSSSRTIFFVNSSDDIEMLARSVSMEMIDFVMNFPMLERISVRGTSIFRNSSSVGDGGMFFIVVYFMFIFVLNK